MAKATEVYCDGCGETLHIHGIWNKGSITLYARKNGWSVGKYDLCPNCKGRRAQLKKEGWIK